MGLVPWEGEIPESFPSLLARGGGHSKMVAICPPSQEEGSHKNQTSWHLDLRLPASRTVRNKCQMVMSPSLWYSVKAVWAKAPQPGFKLFIPIKQYTPPLRYSDIWYPSTKTSGKQLYTDTNADQSNGSRFRTDVMKQISRRSDKGPVFHLDPWKISLDDTCCGALRKRTGSSLISLSLSQSSWSRIRALFREPGR